MGNLFMYGMTAICLLAIIGVAIHDLISKKDIDNL